MNKYHAKKCEMDGIKFDSLRERDRYCDLKAAQQANEISNLKVHVPFSIDINGKHVCKYIADFVYSDICGDRQTVVEDVKGVRTAVYRLKKKLMLACHGIEITEVE